MYVLSPRRSLVAFASALLLALLALAGTGSAAHAQAPLSVSILAPGQAVAAGSDAVFVIVVSGPGAGDALMDYEAAGGSIMQSLGLTEASPGVATATVWVRRDEPGNATLTARTRDGAEAAASAQFAATGTIQVSLTVEVPADGAARTWLFEVRNADGIVVEELVAFTSGDAPSDTAASGALPAGSYTVHPAADATLGSACSAAIFYQVVSPAGGASAVSVGASGVHPVSFRFAACPLAGEGGSVPSATPTQLVAGARTDAEPTPTQRVAGARTDGVATPLAPVTGTGSASADSSLPWWPFAGVLLVMAGASGWLVIARTPPTRID